MITLTRTGIALLAALQLPSFALADQQADGRKVFDNWCSACHAPGDHPGTLSLATKYEGSEPGALEERKNLTPDFVKYTVRHGIQTMPPFRKTEITDAELEALAAYLAHEGK